MRLNFLKSPICLIAAVVIFGVCLLEVFQVQLFQRLEWMSYDWRVKLAHRYAAHSANDATNLGLVDINDNTIAAVDSGEFGYQFGLYWPRQVYARGLEELTRQGAKAVAFDVLFAERRPDQPGVELPDGSSMGSDEYFARQLARSGNVILAAEQGVFPDPLFLTNAWRMGNIGTQSDADGVLRRDQAFEDYREWTPLIRELAAAYNLDLSKTKDMPGKITFFRKGEGKPIEFPTDARGWIAKTNLPPFQPFKKVRIWSIGIVMAARQLNLDLDKAEIDLPHGRIALRNANGLTRIIPVDSQGYFYIDWSMALNDLNLAERPFEELLEAQQEHEAGHPVTNLWKDKLVIIGSTATGHDLTDIGATALENDTFFVSKHWNVANSVISGRFIQPTSRELNLLLIVLFGVFAAWITWVVTRPITGSVVMTVAALAYLGASAELFARWRIWVPIILPLFCAGIVTHVSALTYRLTFEQSERKRIRSIFSRLVSPEVVNKVLGAHSISLESLAGERREITSYFADIRGFTELTDAAATEGTEFVRRHELTGVTAEKYFDEQAREVMRTVSLYLGTVADCIKRHNGTLDKYIGDCVMAFWGAPLPEPRHAVAAVRCAIEAQRCLAALNLRREQANRQIEKENFERLQAGLPPRPTLPVLAMGTGINTGPAIAGFMGSDAHLVNYTVFGREVNLASRLEGISGYGRIIIGDGTYAALQRDDPELAATCLELPAHSVKGFRELVRIYEVPWKPAAAPARDRAKASA